MSMSTTIIFVSAGTIFAITPKIRTRYPPKRKTKASDNFFQKECRDNIGVRPGKHTVGHLQPMYSMVQGLPMTNKELILDLTV